MTKIIPSWSFLLLPSLLLFLIASSEVDNITVYWGQSSQEGGLAETCATRIYSVVSISSYWNGAGDGRSPTLDLTDHCDPSSSGCTNLSTEIKYCQKQGIKVLLFVEGVGWKYNLSSSKDAQNLADYLWNNFLSGNSSSRPFGDAILDGIDLDTRYSTPYWGGLARRLKSHSTATQQVYLSAAPPCLFSNYSLGTHFETSIFDYVWIQFFFPGCSYSEDNPNNFLTAWNQWTTSLNGSKVFLYLAASRNYPAIGYVPPYLLISKVLPIVKKSPNYGGVMLWSRYEDKLSGYSTSIQLSFMCTPQSTPKCRNHDRVFEERYGYMSIDSFHIYEKENLGLQCCETICRNNCSCDAYAPVNQINNSGCQIWGKGTRFIEAAGANGQSIFVVSRKGMSCFLTKTRPIFMSFSFSHHIF